MGHSGPHYGLAPWSRWVYSLPRIVWFQPSFDSHCCWWRDFRQSFLEGIRVGSFRCSRDRVHEWRLVTDTCPSWIACFYTSFLFGHRFLHWLWRAQMISQTLSLERMVRSSIHTSVVCSRFKCGENSLSNRTSPSIFFKWCREPLFEFTYFASF